jgi:methylphosphotriester-DNA--protein-cysteine methyltransferase
VGAVSGSYVASKNGTKYHYPWCSGAKRIKDENKVWFDTVEQARAAGYTPAANCPGLE